MWNEFEPNGKHIEQCVEVVGENGSYKYNDISCHEFRCYSCYLPVRQKLKIRGPVPLEIDSTYLSVVEGNKLVLNGDTKTEIIWENHTWYVGDVIITTGPEQFPPLGLKIWHYVKDEEKLPIELKMSQVKLRYH